MAACDLCHSELLASPSCAWTQFRKYGDEPRVGLAQSQIPERCVHCNVTLGGHHHKGCPAAYCSVCNQKALRCDHAEAWRVSRN
jgi:hypothetical protein